MADPEVTSTWLRDGDVECARCRKWAGPEGDRVYVVKSEGCVCTDCITNDEKARSVRR